MLSSPRCLVSVYSAVALTAALTGCSGQPFQQGDACESGLGACAGSGGNAPVAGAPSAAGSANGGGPQAFSGGSSGAAGVSGSAAAGSGGAFADGSGAGGSAEGGSVVVAPYNGAGAAGNAGAGGSAPTTATGVELDRSNWRVSASNTYFPNTTAENAIDDDPQSCWASGTPQAPGMWFLLDLHEPQTFFRVDVEAIPGSTDYGRHLKLSASLDGKVFTVLRDDIEGTSDLELNFNEAKYARYLKLEITSDAGGLWWRIDDLYVLQ